MRGIKVGDFVRFKKETYLFGVPWYTDKPLQVIEYKNFTCKLLNHYENTFFSVCYLEKHNCRKEKLKRILCLK
jgi:hypothetical protein